MACAVILSNAEKASSNKITFESLNKTLDKAIRYLSPPEMFSPLLISMC